MKSSDTNTNKPNLYESTWDKLKHIFRKIIYPRRFKVDIMDESNGAVKKIDMKATDKFERGGRFTGTADETIVITHDDFVSNFGNDLDKAVSVIDKIIVWFDKIGQRP